MRDLESLESHAVPGTEGAIYPFWSPDSGSLGFFTQGKLKTTAIGGGSPRTLCDAVNGRGGTWNRDGVIVFSPGPVSPLLRVSAAGGPTAPVTTLARDDPSAGHRFPVFLPDGIHLLYTASSNKPDAVGLYWTTIDGGTGGRLLSDLTNALYAPRVDAGSPGYLVFRRGNSLMAQPFDPTALRTTGEVRPIVEGVAEDLNRGFGAFWASASVLMYRTGSSVANRALVWRSRGGTRQGPVGPPDALDQGFRLSPDDRTLALGVFSGDVTYLWLQDLRTNVISRFTFLPGKSPVWSPDGKSLVFARQDVISEIYRRAVTREGQEELLVNAGLNGLPFDWSSDGKWILYQRQEPQTGLDLWLWPVDGESKPVRYLQTPANETLATFSPDGRWIAYQSDESGQMQIYVQTMPASGVKYQISRGGGTRPRWRRDGKELFFISSDDKLVAVPMSLAARVEVGNPQALFSAVGVQDYTPSRDGQRFLMSEMDSREDAGARAITVTMNWMAGLNP